MNSTKMDTKDKRMIATIAILIIGIIAIGIYAYNKQHEYRQVMESQYNMAFFELVGYVQNVEN